jgi:hypothetical protein
MKLFDHKNHQNLPWAATSQILRGMVDVSVRGQVWSKVFLPVRTPVWARLAEQLLSVRVGVKN